MLIHVIGRSCPNWPASARPETVLIFAIPSTGVVPVCAHEELQPLYVNPKLGSRNLRSSFFPEIAQSKGLKLQPHCYAEVCEVFVVVRGGGWILLQAGRTAGFRP